MSRTTSPLRDRMIFVVGARRSGTNWLQRVIGAHPNAASVPSETYIFHTGIPQLADRFHHGVIGSGGTGHVYMDRDVLLDSLRDFCDKVFEGLRVTLKPEAERVVERTPDHVRHLDLMGEIYPDGRFVHIVRDGRDVVRSLRSQAWGPNSIEEAAEEWRTAIESGRSSAPRLNHYLEVRYEELLGESRDQIARLFGWLGLDADAETVDTVLAEANVRYNVDVRSPRVAAGKWRDELSAEDLATFDRVAGETLRDLGYEDAALPRPEARRERAAPEGAGAGGSRRTSRRRGQLARIARRAGDILGLAQAPRDTRLRKELQARALRAQAVANRFLDLVARSKWDDAASMLTDAASVQIVRDGSVWQGRGAQARQRLIETLASDPARGRRQLRGDFHPGVPTCTVVGSYRLEDGTVVDRLWTVTVEGDRIRRISHYSFSSGRN